MLLLMRYAHLVAGMFSEFYNVAQCFCGEGLALKRCAIRPPVLLAVAK